MSTPAEVITELRAKIIAETSATAGLSSGYLTDIDNLAAGATKYGLKWQLQAPQIDSSVTYQILAIEVTMNHHLADFTDENAYTFGAMLTDQQVLIDSVFWREMNTIHDLTFVGGINQIDLSEDVEREGDIMSYSVLAVVSVVPS